MTLAWIVVATLAGGVLSVVVAAGLTLAVLSRLVQHLVSLSTGVLLATALLDILPEAFESKASPQALFATLLGGLLFFFLLEKAELYRHSHHHEGDHHHHHHGFDRQQAGRGGWSVILGDSIHNFCDGIIIAAAFLADTRVGVVTSLAIIAHEIPQEVGDYIVLLNAGFSAPAPCSSTPSRAWRRCSAASSATSSSARGRRRFPTCSWSPRAASSTSPSPT
jgi:zinc and cadmium transporter